MTVLPIDHQTMNQKDEIVKKNPLKDEFLKLLTFQLRYQNPLNPLNNSEFTTQLALLSSLDALNNMVLQMNDLLLFQNSIQNTLTLNLIGRTVKFSGNKFELKEGKGELSYTLSSNAQKVTISVFDSSGKLVKKIEAGPQNAGTCNYVWDGKDTQGNQMPEGTYSFKVEAIDASGKQVEVTTTSKGIVTGVTFENAITYIIVDGKIRLKLNEILEIT
ncbi:MAG: hypothetical protein N2511_04790 [Thermodesulfovibrionales bacterium]|nr:hypothetical protein [Thermodesulfovibrionales bacterium]